MPLSEESAFEAAIIEACAEHEREHKSEPNYRRCVVIQGCFVKFGSYKSVLPVHDTMKYISQFADGDTSAPRIPRVVRFFNRDSKMAYLVMEYIKHTSTPGPDLAQRVARALQWLHDLPAPDSVTIGPIGNALARHVLFKDCKAPLHFLSVDAIERYLNRALNYIPAQARPNPISIRNERLVFTQSDMDASNFGIDDEGNTCLFDFDEVGLLPESFASYTVSSKSTPSTVDVASTWIGGNVPTWIR